MERAGAAHVPASSQTFVKEVTVEVRGPVGAMARLTRLYGHRPGIRA
jgi:hypothetical protein